MPRGNGPQSKILHEGFVIFVEDIASVDKWKLDRSIPLTEVVGNFKIYNTHGYDHIHLDIQICGAPRGALGPTVTDTASFQLAMEPRMFRMKQARKP